MTSRPQLAELAVFAIVGGAGLVSAVAMVRARNPVHAALLLAMTLSSVAVFFILQAAPFLAVIQLIVYAGAVVVLFLFVIMLLGVDKREDLRDRLPGQQLAAGVISLLLAAGGVAVFVTARPPIRPLGENVLVVRDNIQQLAETLFSTFLYPFELTALLLVVAAIAAIVLAKREAR